MVVVDVAIPAHIQAVVDHLNARDILAGYGEKPSGGGWEEAPGQSEFIGYTVVWRSGAIDAQSSMLDGRFDEAKPSIQIDSVGASAAQADALAGLVAVAMLDQSIAVPGRRLLRAWQEVGNAAAKDPGSAGGMGVREKPPLYKSADRYRIWSVPAAS